MDVFVTGGTGYMGMRLIHVLHWRGHSVRALVRPGSESRLPADTEAVTGNALDATTFQHAVRPGDTLVHLVGTPHPSPAKAAEFRSVDLASIRASVEAARQREVRHLVYVSVAQPAPVMHAYVAVRAQGEAMIRDANLTATLLRPWYVLGPGHRWPLLLQPLYAIAERVPGLRDGARRLGLVTIDQMIAALVAAVEAPPSRGTQRVVEVPAIRIAPPR
jgi:nucleoside-diphosphate-sugar epimerase